MYELIMILKKHNKFHWSSLGDARVPAHYSKNRQKERIKNLFLQF